MQAYIEAIDLLMWDVILNGVEKPTEVAAAEPAGENAQAPNAVDVPTTAATCLEEAQRKTAKDTKVKHFLYCALSPFEFNLISSCGTDKEIWDHLPLIEGTDRVKETKMNIRLRSYELFRMKSNEIVTQMFTKFTKIVNGLANQEKICTDVENVNKLLRALPKEWSHVKTSVCNALAQVKIGHSPLLENKTRSHQHRAYLMISSKDHVHGLPKTNYGKFDHCNACSLGNRLEVHSSQ